MLTSESLGDLAITMVAYAACDNIPAYAQSVTDANGRAYFGDLPRGIYLVVGNAVIANGYIYEPQPVILSIPYTSDSGELVTDVYAEVKYERRDISGNDPISRSVKKVWEDTEDSFRPVSVTVQLLKNGTVYDSVVLSDENNWRYTWEQLDADAVWLVTERDVPEGYSVRLSRGASILPLQIRIVSITHLMIHRIQILINLLRHHHLPVQM